MAKKAQRLFFDIVRDIAAEGLQPGDRLPSQAEMAQRYGVGLTPLREALRMLELAGLIMMRPGPAAGVLCEPSGADPLSPLLMAILCLRRISYGQLLDASATAEPLLAAAAAARPDREAVRAALSAFLEHHPPEVARGIAFREAVARAAGNPALVLMAQALSSVVGSLGGAWTDDSSQARAERLIAAAIVAREPGQASRLMEAYVRAMSSGVLDRICRRAEEAFSVSEAWLEAPRPAPLQGRHAPHQESAANPRTTRSATLRAR